MTTQGFEYLRRSAARAPGNIWGYLEINSATTLGPNRWHRDDPDTVFAPENILISSRKANVIALLDKSTGTIVWRLGPYFDGQPGAEHQLINSRTLPRPLDQISGQHNPHFIADGLPGAGNLLVFDNQGGAGYPPAALGIYAGSRVHEIDPGTRQIVWQYTAEDSGRPPWTFHSSSAGGARPGAGTGDLAQCLRRAGQCIQGPGRDAGQPATRRTGGRRHLPAWRAARP